VIGGLNDIVHQPVRLGILTILAEAKRADFPYLKSALELTDGNLGRHLEVLAGAGLVTITKGYEGKRPRTWAEITKRGRAALAAHMAAMKEIVERYESSQTGT
jgi:DNA-binding MarR family transcriptional regulator